MSDKIEQFIAQVAKNNPNEPEFIQAVQEVAETVIPFIETHPKYQGKKLLERMVEPERTLIFRVPWTDDSGEIQVNRGYRVEFNSKGGSDFNPKGKSDAEVMRFCQSFMTELSRHIGANTDVPAGDIGVGGREIGYMFGQYKRLRNEFTGVLTGKGLQYGGSLIRPEATGYGDVYFAQSMLKTKGTSFEGKKVVISGSGNVAQFACEKATQLGGKVVTLSDSGGFIYDEKGIDAEKLAFVMALKNERRGRIKEYLDKYSSATYHEGEKPWGIPCDVALPCATQNELDESAAQQLIDNGCICVAEGANMPTTPDAIAKFQDAKVLFSPGKASNAGGVATSGLEMSQNSLRFNWTAQEVDDKLRNIMLDIHKACVTYGKQDDGYVDYVRGANVAGFVKVAEAMLSQGVV